MTGEMFDRREQGSSSRQNNRINRIYDASFARISASLVASVVCVCYYLKFLYGLSCKKKYIENRNWHTLN